jgi:hypothetical protein
VALLALTAAILVGPLLIQSPFDPPGRYLFPAVGAAAALLAAGLWAELSGKARVVVLAALPAASTVCVLLFAAGFGTSAAVPARPPTQATVAAQSAAGSVQAVQIQLDGAALDSRSRALWVHVTVANDGDGVAEWSPIPSLMRDGRVVGYADYAGSTRFSQTLRPHSQASGWIRFQLASEGVPPESSVRFWGVAVDDYREIGSVELPLGWPASSPSSAR